MNTKYNLHNAEFLTSVFSMDKYPAGTPLIAFAGKSNVGKSSVINALLNRRSLARTSSTPGKTQSVNIYRVDKAFDLVDLPGYGYARVSQDKLKGWGRLMEDFFASEPDIRTVVSVMDARHLPTADDLAMVLYLAERGLPFFILFNKSDKLKPAALAEQCRKSAGHICAFLEENGHGGLRPDFVLFSAEKKTNREEVLNRIFEVLD